MKEISNSNDKGGTLVLWIISLLKILLQLGKMLFVNLFCFFTLSKIMQSKRL